MTDFGRLIDFPQPPTVVCAACGSGAVQTTTEVETFTYGAGEERADLTVEVPVRTCSKCGSSHTDVSAEEIRHAAVCRHLGVMPPGEVSAVRTRYGMSRAEFAHLTRIGEASLSRWENGLNVQNRAMDDYLYLLRFSENVGRLKQRAESRAQPRPPEEERRPVFRIVKPTSADKADAQAFQLRRGLCTS
jgi:YgiT-type zinc finger domain